MPPPYLTRDATAIPPQRGGIPPQLNPSLTHPVFLRSVQPLPNPANSHALPNQLLYRNAQALTSISPRQHHDTTHPRLYETNLLLQQQLDLEMLQGERHGNLNPASDAERPPWMLVHRSQRRGIIQLRNRELPGEAENEFGTNNVTHHRCNPAAEHAIEFLPPVFTPDAELESCAICMDEMRPQDRDDQIAKLPCSHIFHGNCIMKWLRNHNTCPMCRFELPGQRARRMSRPST